ncbi:hypothetical protein IJH26_01570 [Candidatus Saccharibacteria bacterium]|nr:hypothetical protein [Candidatus Saccharibacteria bacterium]MBQ3476182.1 hypothetical protein [Candidatus Saccharibacteria bacterium]
MDGQEYLNQISATSQPIGSTKQGWWRSKFFMWGMGALGVLIVIIIIGSILGSAKGGEKNLSYALLLHLNNTAGLIQEYQPEVKSSALRSSSASLYGVLTNTSKNLNDFLVQKYDYKEKEVDTKIVEAATLEKDGLEADLFEAKINGTLDRIYAHKMAYEISLFMSEEAKLIDSTGDSNLKALLSESHSSLENLYENFNSFSEAK